MSGPYTPRKQLPEALRRAVDQTVAAERLEGWCPTGADLDALAALLCDEVCIDDYLAHAVAAQPPGNAPSRRDHWRALRRRQPYLIPGTTLLHNNFGVCNHQTLAELEFVATAGRIALWHRRSADGGYSAQDVDFRAVHRHVFADVYPWAGEYRVTELRRGDSVFARQHGVPRAMAVIERSARELAVSADRLDAAALGYHLARLYAEYNQIHPFREGNGRTGTLLLHTVAALCGRRLDLTGVSRGEWYSASRDSRPFRRSSAAGGVNPRPFVPLLARALR